MSDPGQSQGPARVELAQDEQPAPSGLSGAPLETSAGHSPIRRKRAQSRDAQARRERALVLAAQTAVILGFFVAWQTLSGNPDKGHVLIDEFFFGNPLNIAKKLVDWWFNGILLLNTWVTLQEALLGFAIGSAGGIVAGFVLGVSKWGSRIFSPLVYAAYSVPRLALAPMFVLWFGLGMGSKIALVATLVFFLTFFNTYAGAMEVDEELVAVCRIMRASRWQVLQKITIPSAAVWVALGLKVSIPFAFVGALIGEIQAGNLGLGSLISQSSNQFDPSGMFAAIIVATVMTIVLNGVVDLGTRYVLRWRVLEAGRRG